MNVNVERNLLARFHKDERNLSPLNQNPLNSWLSQAFKNTHEFALRSKIKQLHWYLNIMSRVFNFSLFVIVEKSRN